MKTDAVSYHRARQAGPWVPCLQNVARWCRPLPALTLLLAAGLVGMVALPLLFSARQQAAEQRLFGVLQPLDERVQDLTSALLDMETGVRGYALTGSPTFLEPYHLGQQTYGVATPQARALAAQLGAPVVQQLDAALAVADAWQTQVAAPLAAPAAGSSAVRLVASIEGKQQFDALRAALATLTQSVQQELVQQQARVRAVDAERTRVVVLTALLALTTAGVVGLLVRRSLRQFAAHRALQGKLQQLAFSDPLTGLANRALLMNRLEQALARLARDAGRERLGLLFVDLDNFKAINDQYGHDAGDRLLQVVGERLASSLRAGDTGARFGGDEFTALLEPLHTPGIARDVAARLLDRLAEPCLLGDGIEVQVQASVGIAVAGDGALPSPSTLLREADIALYQAKAAGKGQAVLFSSTLSEEEPLWATSRTTHASAPYSGSRLPPARFQEPQNRPPTQPTLVVERS